MEKFYGGFWLRVVSYAIDAIVLSIFGGIFGVMARMTGLNPMDPTGQLMLLMANLSLAFIYNVGMNFVFAGTIGKRVLGLQVLDSRTLERITFTQSCVRSFMQFISGLVICLGYISIAFNKRKQGWHDSVAGTVVVKDSFIDQILHEEERVNFQMDDAA